MGGGDQELRALTAQGDVLAAAREKRNTVCAEARRLRGALEWEERRASSAEAVWVAVFEPLSWAARTEGSDRIRPAARPKPSPMAERYFEAETRLLRGYPPSQKRAFAELAVRAVADYQSRRHALIFERICTHRDEFTTSEALGATLSDIETLVAPTAEALVTDVLAALDPTVADKLTSYAEAESPPMWQASPAFYDGWSAETVAQTVDTLCRAAGADRTAGARESQTPR